MTNFLDISKNRHTCKSYDKNKRIDDKTLQDILESLRLSPSSINIQPWHFLVAGSDTAKERIIKSTIDSDAHNIPKIMNASHIIILCTRTKLGDEHLDKILNAEDKAGRFKAPESKEARRTLCQNYLKQFGADPIKLFAWAEQQTFIALGHLLMVAALAGVDATPIGGFNIDILNKEFNLANQNLSASVMVALGYGGDDFNKALPKARLDYDEVIEFI